jgi:hypothetical protein
MRKLKKYIDHDSRDLTYYHVELLRLLYRHNSPLTVKDCIRDTDQSLLITLNRLEYLLANDYIETFTKEGIDKFTLADLGRGLVTHRTNRRIKTDVSNIPNSIFQLAEKLEKKDIEPVNTPTQGFHESRTIETI